MNEALNELATLTASIEKQVQELKDAASEYVDEASHAKKTDNPLASFGGSEAQKTLDAISIKLKAAGSQVQFVGAELIRFV